jgi:uncharacterized protein YlzI (FlbEa/FlbD family)
MFIKLTRLDNTEIYLNKVQISSIEEYDSRSTTVEYGCNRIRVREKTYEVLKKIKQDQCEFCERR